ncbi:Mce-associated membrane protein [Phycicoccus duodecadis]|uniref:Mce-associated membrane protein n=1 Tax=Phycicoccus duodecadis TaxID=173053 RepID=A0A2N3YHI3_9MICO|nr:Mce-associated membrane protein [Phycicoccus duodecadis]
MDEAAEVAPPVPRPPLDEAPARPAPEPEPAAPAPRTDTGTAERVDAEPPGETAGPSVTVRDLRAPLVALLVVVLLFAAVASVAFRDHGARERDARAATAAARTSLEALLSYDYQTIAAQAQQNTALLTGQFRTEYGQTMQKTIAPVAEKEKAVVRARSYEAGVMGQTPDTVTVEVFLNQAKASTGQAQPSIDQNRVIATMQRVGDRWLISGLSAF